MAAVYAVRRSDESGFDKLLAMKLLLPQLAEDPHFRGMFMDEARIAAQVQHPNVVQVFDVGQVRQLPYLVMEFLRGQPLHRVTRRLGANESLSRELLLHILAETATGLHAAHNARSVDGTPLRIVHRDVSPQNVHIGYDGIVRVVDFGIAAAVGRTTTTRSGEIKGKLSYLAPEALHRRFDIDHRADIWALGVMAWQTFARRRLFKTDTEAETLYNILHKPVPPLRDLVPEIEPAIEQIVARCLARIPDDRPETAEEVARVFRNAAGLGAHSADLGGLLTVGFEVEAREAEQRIRDALSTASAPSKGDGRARVADDGAATAKSRSRKGWFGVAAIAVAAIAGAFAMTNPGSTAPDAQSTATVDEPPAAHPEEVASAPDLEAETARTVRFNVADDVRHVMVDGQLHSERPVEVTIADEARVTILAVGMDGRESLTELGHDDGDSLITVAPRPARRRARRRAQPTSSPSSEPSVRGRAGLLAVPLPTE